MKSDDSVLSVDQDRTDERPSSTPTGSTELYWAMPGPRGLIETVASSIRTYRWVALRVPAASVPGLHTALDLALQRAHFENEHIRWIKLEDGMRIPTQIGAALGSGAVFPEELATVKSAVRTIVLDARSDGAIQACQRFLSRFSEASGQSVGYREHACVLALLPESTHSVGTPSSNAPQEIVFSGALSPQEMAAYVGVRMIERPGPGGTGLLRALAAEFSGFDVSLAEHLIAFSDEALLALPSSLEPLAARAEGRWRIGRWSTGCYASVAGQDVRHTLYELHLSRHSGPEQRVADESLKRRFWRACVQSMLPWLEERRSAVMNVLRRDLERHLQPTGGKSIRVSQSGHRIERGIDDIEYNQIPAFIRYEGFERPSDPKKKLAVDVCFAAKKVRDDIAHMRAPMPADVLKVIDKMTRLLTP